MKANPEVERWFAAKRPPAEPAMRRVRDVIMGADRRMSEYLKYGTLVFGYEGDFASFVQTAGKTASLMFNRGARIPGRFPHLEGTGPTARFMRFADEGEVRSRATELGKIARAWCDLMEPASASTASGRRAKPAAGTKARAVARRTPVTK